jgi:hypothetical protein
MNAICGRRWATALVAGGVAVAILLGANPALAIKGDTISAVVNGHERKFKGKTACGGYTPAAFAIVGGTKFHGLNRLIRSLAVSCVDVDLATSSFPLTPAASPPANCTIGYTEMKVSLRHPITREWSTTSTPDNSAIQVTVTSFDGTRAQGTFSGTIAALTGATTPATVTSGSFSVVLPLNNNLCTAP